VVKYRGSGYSSNECPFVITSDGVVLMPVSSAELLQTPLGARMSSGSQTLDSMLGGGYRQGSSVLIAGPTGSGKTTLACTFAQAAGERGERTLYISFEEAEQGLLSAMESPGLDLSPLVEEGSLKILTAMPESMGVEEHLLRVLRVMDRFQPHHLVVDAISAADRMGSKAAAFDFLVRLLAACHERGLTCFYLNQTGRGRAVHHISGIGISSLIDTALVLDYVWRGDEMARSLLVLKTRGSWHSPARHWLRITDEGIAIDPPDAAPEEGGGA
jgi:circadian clock protein KaiC